MPDIAIRGNTYAGVPAVKSPLANGQGDAYFYYTEDATLQDGGKLAAGETAYSKGVLVTGTAPENDSSDLTVSGATVTAPAGIYEEAASKSVATGTATAPTSISGTSATVSTGTNTITLSKTVSVTPRVTTAGYVSAGTAGNASVSLTASVTTKAAATITPGTTAQEIAAGTYLTGKQTIAGDSNLKGSNIVSGVSIFGTAGTAQIPVISQDSTTHILSIS
jgi:hypothetical protein